MPRRSATPARRKAGRAMDPITKLLGNSQGSERVRLFAERCLRNSDGSPFRFRDWQMERIIRPLYDQRNAIGLRQFRNGYVSMARKNGKTTLVGVLSCYHLFADNEPKPRVYAAASAREQAGLTYDTVAAFIEKSPVLSGLSQVQRFHKAVRVPSIDGEFHTLAADAPATLGLNPSFAILDEIAEQPHRDLYDSLATSMGARRQPLLLSVGTAGFDAHSIARELYDSAKRGDDPTFFSCIYELPEGADWTDPALWPRANPALGDFRDADELRAQVERAQQVMSYRNTVRRFCFNEWVSSETAWIDMAKWDAAPPLDIPSLEGEPAMLAWDIGAVNDLTALSAIFPHSDGTYSLLLRVWVPSENIRERIHRDRVPYGEWEKLGFVEFAPGPSVDLGLVEDAIRDWRSRYQVQLGVYDKWNALHLAQRMEAEGMAIAEFPQNIQTFSAPTKEFERLVLESKIRHGNNPVLRWMLEGCTVYVDKNQNVRPIKPDRRRDARRIDGVVTSVMALGAAMGNKPAGRSVYEDRGLLTI
jgi:phage terminase large subunit-like protein